MRYKVRSENLATGNCFSYRMLHNILPQSGMQQLKNNYFIILYDLIGQEFRQGSAG